MKRLFLFLILGFLSLPLFAAQTVIFFCHADQFATELTAVSQQYKDARAKFISDATAISCYPEATGDCDQVKLKEITNTFQNITAELGVTYEITQSSNGDCYPEYVGQNSPFEAIAEVAETSSTQTQTAGSGQCPSGRTPDADGWCWTSLTWGRQVEPYGCKEVYYLKRKCADIGQGVASCKRGNFASPNGGNGTNFKCGGPVEIKSGCESYYGGSYGSTFCGVPEENWDQAASCLTGDKIAHRLRSCPRGCVRRGKSYPPNANWPSTIHLCDWSTKEKKDFHSCSSSPMAHVVKSACPNAKADADDSEGNPPRIWSYSFSYHTNLQGKRLWVVGRERPNIKISAMSVRGHKASYCIHKIDVPCDLIPFPGLSGNGRSGHSERTFSSENLTTGDYEIVLKNDTNGKSVTRKFSAIHFSDIGSTCEPGLYEEITGQPEVSPMAPTGTAPSSDFEGKTCGCVGNSSIKDSSDRRWRCSKDPDSTFVADARCMYYNDPGGDRSLREEKFLATNGNATRTIMTSKRREKDCSEGSGKITEGQWHTQKIVCKSDGSLRASSTPATGWLELTNTCGGENPPATEVENPPATEVANPPATEVANPPATDGEADSPDMSADPEPQAASSCVYYDYVGGKGPHVVKRMNVGEEKTRDLAGKKVILPCRIESMEGSREVLRYTEQVISCSGDVSAEGDGLGQVSATTKEILIKRTCRRRNGQHIR